MCVSLDDLFIIFLEDLRNKRNLSTIATIRWRLFQIQSFRVVVWPQLPRGLTRSFSGKAVGKFVHKWLLEIHRQGRAHGSQGIWWGSAAVGGILPKAQIYKSVSYQSPATPSACKVSRTEYRPIEFGCWTVGQIIDLMTCFLEDSCAHHSSTSADVICFLTPALQRSAFTFGFQQNYLCWVVHRWLTF